MGGFELTAAPVLTIGRAPKLDAKPTSGGLFGNWQGNVDSGGIFAKTKEQDVAGGSIFGKRKINAPKNDAKPAGSGLFGTWQDNVASGGIFAKTKEQDDAINGGA